MGFVMLFVQLYRMDEDYLTSQDALRRIAPSFRYVVIDRARGEKEYLKHWTKLIALNAPKVILESMSL